MAVSSLNQNNFLDHIADNDITVVKFGAPWCGPCKSMAPMLDRAAQQFTQISFAEVNVDESPALAARYNIRSLPTLVAWKNGTVQWTKIGLPNPNDLHTALSSLG